MSSNNVFYQSVKESIKNGQWDQLTLYPNPSGLENQWLLTQLLILEEEFTEETYRALQRLFGPHTPSEWTTLLVKLSASFPAILSLLEHGNLNVHSEPSIVHYVLNHGLYDPESKLELLDKLFAHGADVNKKSHNGFPIFQSYVCNMTHHLIHYEDNKQKKQDISRELRMIVPYLLQKGADPLLQNNDGVNTIDLVRPYLVFLSDEKEWLLSTLQA